MMPQEFWSKPGIGRNWCALSRGSSAIVRNASGWPLLRTAVAIRCRRGATPVNESLRHSLVFSPEWLSLREPADTAARSETLTRALADALPGDRPVRILDLGSGTGANARYLFQRLRIEQEWLLADHDAALLSLVGDRLASADGRTCRVATRRVDLSALDDDDFFRDRHLVTASALLDLVSEPWVTRVAQHCRRSRAVALFALTYDGRIECEPEDSGDQMIRELVNRHQRMDKGFGPALGPSAADSAARAFEDAGFAVRRAASDWVLKPDMRELQRQLLEGWASAAAELDARRSDAVEQWRSRRLSFVNEGLCSIRVGHQDLLAVPRD